MAGDWIKMRVDLGEDPAVITIADELDMDEFAVVGRLHRIWSWASAHTADGSAQVSAARIDKIAQRDGFARAMERVGWLRISAENESQRITIPAFDRHNSKSAKRRATEATRKKRVRKVSAPRPQNVRTECGPEKRREEKSLGEESPKNPSCSEPSKTTTSEPAATSPKCPRCGGMGDRCKCGPAVEESPAVFPVFECNGKEGQRRWTLTDEQLQKLCEAFPGVAVRGECRKAWAWIDANPSKRKTARGMPGFLFRWMEREQNRNRSQTPMARGRPTVAEHNADAFREVFGDEDDDGTDDQHETAPPAQGLLRGPGDQGDRGQPADVARRPG